MSGRLPKKSRQHQQAYKQCIMKGFRLKSKKVKTISLGPATHSGNDDKAYCYLVRRYAAEKGLADNMEKAHRMIAKILWAFRNNFSVEDNAIFMAQLPEELQQIYVKGWGIRHQLGAITHTEDLIKEVIYEDNRSPYLDFMSELDVLESIVFLFSLTKKHVKASRFDIINKMLPKDLVVVIATGSFSGTVNDCL